MTKLYEDIDDIFISKNKHKRSTLKKENEHQKETPITIGYLNNALFKLIKRVNLIDEEQEQIQQTMFKHIDSVLNHPNFITSFNSKIIQLITREIQVQIVNNDVFNDVDYKIRSCINNNLPTIIREATDTTVKNLVKKYAAELRAAKDLCYSVDSTIKHCLMEKPISLQFENRILIELRKEMKIRTAATLGNNKKIEVLQ